MIVTVTMNPALDKSTSVDKLIPEKKLRCDNMHSEPGGGGINVSKAIKKLGGESIAIFPSGGNNGKLITDHLENLGIICRTIPVPHETRENIGVLETSTNAQYRFVMPGYAISQREADECFRILENLSPKPQYIVASGSLPPGLPEDFYAQLCDVSLKLGARYVVDTSGTPLELALAKGVFMIKPNLSELAKLTGRESLELNEVDDAAMELIHRHKTEIIVVTLGPSGALLVTKEGFEHIPAPTVRKQSTVGAGDSTVAGMIWMLSQNKSIREMVRFGVACGTAATMNPGTTLFHEPDVHKLHNWIRQYGEKYKLNLD
jgi:6-phosphofructokinase 2